MNGRKKGSYCFRRPSGTGKRSALNWPGSWVEQDNLSPYFDGEPCLLPYVVTPEQSAAVQNRGWTGVMALPVQFRYGEQQLAAQVIGHLGKISTPEEFTDLSGRNNKVYHYDDLVGKTGLEMYYEDVLKGSLPQRAVRVYTDAAGRLLGDRGFLSRSKQRTTPGVIWSLPSTPGSRRLSRK